jgi:hypothetical protein
MRTPALPPSSLYLPRRDRTRSRFQLSGMLPWGEMLIVGILLAGFNMLG